jgi:hypothetical protein
MQGGSDRAISRLFNAPFLTCVFLLGGTAAGLGPVTRYMKIALTKEAIEMRAPLGTFDKSRLGPYQFRRGVALEEAILNSLGTEMYIDWLLEDSEVTDRRSPLRYVQLFVTYYTGQPDPVPHTPDVCYKAGGYTSTAVDNFVLSIPHVEADVPIRVITFEKSSIQDRDRLTVIYLFHCNGQFAAKRNKVRWLVSRPSDRYAYFSKVEIVFGGPNSQPRYATREQSVTAAKRLFSHVLPVLLENHWPDWEVVKQGKKPGSLPAES